MSDSRTAQWLKSLQQRSTTTAMVRWLAPVTKLAHRVPAAASATRWLPRVEEGLPPALDDATCRRLSEDLGVGDVTSAWFVALNGWRASAWTTRLFLRGTDGNVTSVVCKATDYLGQLSAARGLPLEPGPPEVAVLDPAVRTASSGLRKFLPVSYFCQTLGPGKFLLILEDLGPSHRLQYDFRSVMRVVDRLPALQRALADYAGEGPWLEYEDALKSNLFRDYVRQHLGQYCDDTGSEVGHLALKQLDDLLAGCTWPEWPEDSTTMVHGDVNVANVMHPRLVAAGGPVAGGPDIRFIDWEWAGHNVPHADLAALTKSLRNTSEETRAVLRFISHYPQWSTDQHEVMYNQAKLARSLLDASFLSAQRSCARLGARLDIEGPLGRALDAAQELRESPSHRKGAGN